MKLQSKFYVHMLFYEVHNSRVKHNTKQPFTWN